MNEQRKAYETAETVASDPFGIIDRNNRNHQKKAEIIEAITAARRGDAILEVGCGHGLHTARYSRLYDVTAIDLSDSLVRTAQERAPMADCRQADALALPFDDNEFRAVHGAAILHHLPDAREALCEWLRVTESGGSVTLMEPNYLFPKDFITTYVVPEERHKWQMKPWHVRRVLQDIDHPYRHEPRIYTPPWPRGWHGAYDYIDDLATSVPIGRWFSQMQLIHVRA